MCLRDQGKTTPSEKEKRNFRKKGVWHGGEKGELQRRGWGGQRERFPRRRPEMVFSAEHGKVLRQRKRLMLGKEGKGVLLNRSKFPQARRRGNSFASRETARPT